MAGATGAMTGFAFPEILVKIVALYRAGKRRRGGRRLLSRGAADAVRVPGRDRHGDPQGSAAPPRRARERRRPARPRRALDETTREALDRVMKYTERRRRGRYRRAKARKTMDLGLKGKSRWSRGASQGLGFAVAQALAARRRAASRSRRATRRRSTTAAKRIERETGAQVLRDGRWTSATRRRSSAGSRDATETFGGIDALLTNSGGPPAGAGGVVRRRGVAGRGGPAAVQHAPHGPRRRAVDEGARRRRDPDVHVVVGQGADPEPRAVDRAARVGLGAGEDAGARARGRRRSASTRSSPAASTPTACGSSTRSTRRSRASRPSEAKAQVDGARSRWDATARPTSSAASARSCSRTRRPT